MNRFEHKWTSNWRNVRKDRLDWSSLPSVGKCDPVERHEAGWRETNGDHCHSTTSDLQRSVAQTLMGHGQSRDQTWWKKEVLNSLKCGIWSRRWINPKRVAINPCLQEHNISTRWFWTKKWFTCETLIILREVESYRLGCSSSSSWTEWRIDVTFESAITSWTVDEMSRNVTADELTAVDRFASMVNLSW